MPGGAALRLACAGLSSGRQAPNPKLGTVATNVGEAVKAKPSGAEVECVEKIALSSTQGKGVKVDPASMGA